MSGSVCSDRFYLAAVIAPINGVTLYPFKLLHVTAQTHINYKFHFMKLLSMILVNLSE